VHLAVEPHVLDDVAAWYRLQRAAVVVQRHARDARDDAVRHPAHPVALDRGILPLPAPAGHHVVTFRELLEQRRDVGGVVLQVRVDGNQHLSRRVVDGRHHGGRLAVVPAKLEHLEPRVLRGEPPQHGHGAVGAAVVDGDDFVGHPEFLHHRGDLLDQQREVLLLVEDRGQDRDGEARRHGVS
jgi:hypothetical protein